MRVSYIILVISVVLSIITGVLTYNYTEFYEIKSYEKALDGVLLLSSISLGFYGACLSVLASIFNTKIVKEIINEPEDKLEFIIVICSTLLIGFLTVVMTIIYQVFIGVEDIEATKLNFIDAIWSSLVVMFMFMKILFVMISFLILFNNNGENIKSDGTNVYTPKLKNQ